MYSHSIEVPKVLETWEGHLIKPSKTHSSKGWAQLKHAKKTVCMLVMHTCTSNAGLGGQMQPTSCIFSVWWGFLVRLKIQQPPRASMMSIMGPIWAAHFLQNPRYVKVSKIEKQRPNYADDAGRKILPTLRSTEGSRFDLQNRFPDLVVPASSLRA